MNKLLFVALLGCCFFNLLYAQDSMPKMPIPIPPVLEQKITNTTFDRSRLINTQTVDMTEKGSMEISLYHSFGANSVGAANNLFINLLVGVDYTPVDWLNIGLYGGNKIANLDLKFKILNQQKGSRNIPLSIAALAQVYMRTAASATDPAPATQGMGGKLAYFAQFMFASKICKIFSLQLTPTMTYYGAVPIGSTNNIYSLGLGAKFHISPMVGISLEYTRQLNGYLNQTTYAGGKINYAPDFVSLGVDVNVIGHKVQLFLSNAPQITSPGMFNVNESPFNMRDIKVGLSFAKAFNIHKKKVKDIPF